MSSRAAYVEVSCKLPTRELQIENRRRMVFDVARAKASDVGSFRCCVLVPTASRRSRMDE